MVVGQPMAGASMPQLTSTGSSFAGVAISQWQGQFNELDGGNVNFAVSSSTIGLNDFCDQTVSFGASDLSYAAGQSDCDPTQVPYHYQYVPDVGGSLAFEYNLTGHDRQADQQPVAQRPDDRRDLHGCHLLVERSGHCGVEPECEPAQRDDHRVLPCRPVGGELPAVGLPARRPTRICWRPSSRWRPTRIRERRFRHLGLLPQRHPRRHHTVPEPPRA